MASSSLRYEGISGKGTVRAVCTAVSCAGGGTAAAVLAVARRPHERQAAAAKSMMAVRYNMILRSCRMSKRCVPDCLSDVCPVRSGRRYVRYKDSKRLPQSDNTWVGNGFFHKRNARQLRALRSVCPKTVERVALHACGRGPDCRIFIRCGCLSDRNLHPADERTGGGGCSRRDLPLRSGLHGTSSGYGRSTPAPVLLPVGQDACIPYCGGFSRSSLIMSVSPIYHCMYRQADVHLRRCGRGAPK